MALLSRIMIRAAKSDLVTIPPCHHKVSASQFSITLHCQALVCMQVCDPVLVC